MPGQRVTQGHGGVATTKDTSEDAKEIRVRAGVMIRITIRLGAVS